MRAEVAADIQEIFDAPERAEADRRLELAVRKCEKTAPKLAAWLADNVPDGLTIFALPPTHWPPPPHLQSARAPQQTDQARTRLATLFPNEAALLRLVSAVLMEISEEWETEKIYLRMANSGPVMREE